MEEVRVQRETEKKDGEGLFFWGGREIGSFLDMYYGVLSVFLCLSPDSDLHPRRLIILTSNKWSELRMRIFTHLDSADAGFIH